MTQKIGIDGARRYAGMYADMCDRMGIGQWNTHAFLRDNMRECEVEPGSIKMEMKECYNNSAIQTLANGLDFVDGFVSVCGILVRHAWNADGDQMLDFTIENPGEREYFGIRYPAKMASKVIKSRAWAGSEGVTGALQRLKAERRNRLLRQAGFKINEEVRNELEA